jgi:hypothetical protein
MSLGSQIIYKGLLRRHELIRVPMIQRDYAQGRPEEAEVRETFLSALKEALQKPADDPTLPMNLDFIYGSVEGDEETRFLPLDGQQRLTTLFLLHWYLAWKDDQWESFVELFQVDGKARFSYSVRPSSNEFFEELVGFQPSMVTDEVDDLTLLITDQSWYFRNWRLDPTIQAALYMLETIHTKFKLLSGLFGRLVDEDKPAITFQLLDLENFGLSDDLYIKMNARGKPLTAFETFKARYELELKSLLEDTTFEFGGQHFNASEYFARRMDITWADLFWRLRDDANDLYDDAVMNVFRAVALVTRQPDHQEYINDVNTLRNWTPSYTDFNARGWLDKRFTIALIHLLDSWCGDSGKLNRLLPDDRFFDEESVFKKIVSNGANLVYTEIVQIAAYSAFIVKYQPSVDSNAFQEWMRIILNLSINTDYNRPADLQRSIRGLDELLEISRDVVQHFVQSERPASGFSGQQIVEEKIKAELILANEDWRALIDRAEGHGYFRGQIDFLLDFSGVIAAREKSDTEQWDAEKHLNIQESFLRYLRLAEKMFSTDGLIETGEYLWQRALLSIGNYMLQKGRNVSFLVKTATDEASWKRLLRGGRQVLIDKRDVLQQLWDCLSPNDDISDQLAKIIDESEQIDPWLDELVNCPEAIRYCEKKYIRIEGIGKIYLLKKTQMNGYHAELFTFCLYENTLKSLELTGKLKPLRILSYQSVVGSDIEPGIPILFRHDDKDFCFEVEYQNGRFLIKIKIEEVTPYPIIESILTKKLHFSKNISYFTQKSTPDNIENSIIKMAEELSTFQNLKESDA